MFQDGARFFNLAHRDFVLWVFDVGYSKGLNKRSPPLIKRSPPHSDDPLGSLKLAQNSRGQTLLHKLKRGAAPKAPLPVSDL